MADRHPKQPATFAVLARWALLLAAVHRWSGPAIIAVVLAAAGAEALRRRWSPNGGLV
jgi:hypothetical protein